MTGQTDLVELTRQIVHNHFTWTADPALYFDENLMWIGPLDFQWGTTAPNTKEITKLNLCQLKDELYFITEKGRNHQVICGAFKALHCHPEGSSVWLHFRLTFVWKKQKQAQWKIIHIHVSQSYDIPQRMTDPIEVLPNSLKEAYLDKPKSVLRDNQGRLHYLAEDEILYIKADNLTSIIILEDERFSVREGISDLEKRLSQKFLRIHRSYLVNRNHVRSLERFRVQIRNGDWIPIPERKYTDMKEALNQGKDT